MDTGPPIKEAAVTAPEEADSNPFRHASSRCLTVMDFVPPAFLGTAVNALFEDRFSGGSAKLSKRQRKSLLKKKFPGKYSRKHGFLNG